MTGAAGASGGSCYGGKGVTVIANITVSPGDTLYVMVGGIGTSGLGGYNGELVEIFVT